MTYLLLCLGIFCLYTVMGLGVFLALAPARLHQHALLLAPLCGSAAVIPVGWTLWAHQIGGTDRYAGGILMLGLAVLALVGWKAPQRVRTALHPEGLWAPLGAAIVGLVSVSMPMFLQSGLTMVSCATDDGAFYAWGSRLLQEFAPNAHVGLFATVDMEWYVVTRFAIYYLTGWTASMLHLGAWQVIFAVAAVAFSLGALALYVTAVEAFDYEPRNAALLSAMYGLSPMMASAVTAGFFTQVLASAYSIGFLLFVLLGMSDRPNRLGHGVLAALMGWGVLACYPHMIPLLLLPLLGVALFGPGRRHNVMFLTAIVAAIFLYSTEKFGMLIRELYVQSGNDGGGFTPFVVPYRWFNGKFLELPNLHAQHIEWGLSALLIAIVGGALGRLARTRPQVAWQALVCTLCITAYYVGLALLNDHKPGGYLGGYKSMKILAFMLPWLLVALFAGCGSSVRGGRALLWIMTLYELASVGCFLPYAYFVPETASHLEQVEADPAVHSINLWGSNNWNVVWDAYFLAHKPLSIYMKTYMPPSRRMDGEWNLEDSQESARDGNLKMRGFAPAERLLISNQFSVVRWSAPVATLQEPSLSISGPQPGATLHIFSPRSCRVDVRSTCSAPPRHLVARLNGEPAPQVSAGPHQFTLPDLALRPGVNVVRLWAAPPTDDPFTTFVVTPAR